MSPDIMVPPYSETRRFLPNFTSFLQSFSFGARHLFINTFLITGFYCVHPAILSPNIPKALARLKTYI